MIYNAKLNKLIRSVVALVMIMMLLISATFAWLSTKVSTKVDTSDFITVTADTGLNMNYGEGNNNQGQMEIPSDCVLTECSSYDGRNFFFPLSAYGDGDRDFTNGIQEDDEYIFRQATALDKNKKYISREITLSSEDDTSVWLSNDSYIKNTGSKQTSANSIRVAFIENIPEGKSVVFDNSYSSEYAENNFNKGHYKAIASINPDGSVLSHANNIDQRPHAISEYAQNGDGNVLFELKAGIPLHITVNIWLEGTDPHCTDDYNVLEADDLEIFIKFSTTYESMNIVYFKDFTLEKWVDHDGCYVFAIDEEGNHHSLTKSANYANDYTWYGEVPETATNLRFVRYNPETQASDEQEWNYWEAGALGSCKTYNAFGHSAGMWSDTFSPTTITLFDGTPDGFIYVNNYDSEHENALAPYVVHVAFTTIDGNGDEIYNNFKLSYHHNRTDWKINIPSQVEDIDIYMYYTNDFNDDTPMDIENPDYIWETTRGDNLYYTMYFDDDLNCTGYWSDELIYLDAHTHGNFKDGETLASYFFDTESDFISWVGMHAKSDNGHYIAAVPPELMKSNMVDENPNTATVYFTNSQGWKTPKVYYWINKNGSETNLTSWPGIDMTYSHKNGYGQDIYKAEVPMEANCLIFSDNGDGNKRTNDIKNVTLYDGIGFYANADKTYGSFTNYRPGVIFTRYDSWAMNWIDGWDCVFNQTTDDKSSYGTKNLFVITDYADDGYYMLGDWY